LRKPPSGISDEAVKSESADLVGEVLEAIKDGDIKSSVDALTVEQLDSLMKYIYRGLATCNRSNAYLKWHEQALARGGLGSIVRCLAERKTVVDSD